MASFHGDAISTTARAATSGAEPLREVIVDIVAAKILLQRRKGRLRSDQDQFDAGDGGEILEHLPSDAIAETRVMRPAGENPSGAGRLEVGLAFPDGASDRQLGQGGMIDRGHFVD